MRVITFYSYKGGVGRTLACANFGLYLAKTGQKVVLADMDFEAPGLDSKFSGLDPAGFRGGMLDQFSAFQRGEMIPPLEGIGILIPPDVARSGGSLHLIPAGNYLAPKYYRNLAALQWEPFLDEKAGLAFCLDFPRRVEETFGADVLVIDSRTGLTEVGGLCTQALPDTVLLFTCASPESLAGTKRIYSRISNSPIVKNRLGGRDKVDLRIVIARTPRPEDLPAFDQAMRRRLGLDVDRLYYLFDQRDLSVEEYLALDRFVEKHPGILDDYVELFASFNPEITLPYIEKRLEAFRTELTRRPPHENERLIQELLMLFPRPEVFLEAARYFRLAKGGEAKTVSNYVRYLSLCQDNAQVLNEFAEVCTSVQETELKPREAVSRFLRNYGADRMNAPLMERYFALTKSDDDWREIVSAIESNEEKLRHPEFRSIYFRALHSMREWKRIVANVSQAESRFSGIGLLVAEAHCALGNAPAAREVLTSYRVHTPDELLSVFRLLFRIAPEADIDKISKFVEFPVRETVDEVFMALRRSRPERHTKEDMGFLRWLERLRDQARQR